MGGEYFSAKNIDISLFLCYNYKNNLGRQIMEELLKRLMSYARCRDTADHLADSDGMRDN